MKKETRHEQSSFLWVFLVLLLSCIYLMGCEADANKAANNTTQNVGNEKIGEENKEPVQGTFPGLDADTEMQIKIDFQNWNGNPVELAQYMQIKTYYGIYDGWRAVFIQSSNAAYMGGYTIEGMAFKNIQGNDRILLWKQTDPAGNYSFYKLDDAYGAGLISLDDIKTIHTLHMEAHPELYL